MASKTSSFSLSSETSRPSTWLPDHHSTVCMKCNETFSKVYGVHRSHCRMCGYLICNKCVVAPRLFPYVVQPKQIKSTYIAPGSDYRLLKRPPTTSTLGTLLQTFSSPDQVKLCDPCATKLHSEHTSLSRAHALLGAMAILPTKWVHFLATTCVRAHKASLPFQTPMSLIGARISHVLREGFFVPKTRSNLQRFDEALNLVLVRLFRSWLGKRLNTGNIEIDSNHNFMIHTFTALLLNTAHASDMRKDLVEFVLSDPTRAMHVALSNYLDYNIQIDRVFQKMTWTRLARLDGMTTLLENPYLLPSLARSSASSDDDDPQNYEQFIKVMISSQHALGRQRQVSTKVYKLLLVLLSQGYHDYGLFNQICLRLGVAHEKARFMIDALYETLKNVCYAEKLETTVNVPWTLHEPYLFKKYPQTLCMLKILNKIYSYEPRTLPTCHLISRETTHVAHIFQSWMVFPEPHGVLNDVMRHLFTIIRKIHKTAKDDEILTFSSLEFMRRPETDLVIGVAPVHGNTLVKLVTPGSFDGEPEHTVDLLMLILLLSYLETFMTFPDTSNDLGLVETTTTPRNTVKLTACLTFAAVPAIRKHLLKKSLHAMTVVTIEDSLRKLFVRYLPELWIALLPLQGVFGEYKDIQRYLNTFVHHVEEETLRSVIISQLV